MSKATYDDVNLILRLYDIRREEKLRAARVWFVTNFKPKTSEEYKKLIETPEANAYFRQSVTYWDMVAGFITSGVLNEELFFQSGRELVLFWLRLKPIVAGAREFYKDPNAYKNLETVADAYAKHLGPEAFAAFAARVAP
jgi:hypothetical protein